MNLKYDEFLDLTPSEFGLRLEGYINNKKEQYDSIKIQAWTTAILVKHAIVCAFNKDAKFPELESLFKKMHEPQTPEQMEDAMRNICIAFGGKIVEIEG